MAADRLVESGGGGIAGAGSSSMSASNRRDPAWSENGSDLPLRNPSNRQQPLYTDDNNGDDTAVAHMTTTTTTGRSSSSIYGYERNESTVDAAAMTLLMSATRNWSDDGHLAADCYFNSSSTSWASTSHLHHQQLPAAQQYHHKHHRHAKMAAVTNNSFLDGMGMVEKDDGGGGCRESRGGPRLTIFSEDFLRELHRRHGGVDMTRILQSATGAALQTIVFFIMVMFLGVTPLVKEAALWDEEKGAKVQTFAVHSPYVAHYGWSVVIANLAAWLTYGKVGLRDCWNCRSIMIVSRVSVFYAIGEPMELITLCFVDGTSWKILSQLKLPLTAILNYFLLGRKQSSTQWSIISSTMLSIVGYCLATQVVSGSTGSSGASVWGLILGVFNVLIVTLAATGADYTYKQVKYPFFILVAQCRVSACLITFVVMIVWKAYHLDATGFFHGWNCRIWFLTAWLLVRDWSAIFVLRNLDSMWKALGTAMGLCLTYTLANLIIRYNLHMLVFIFVLSVVVNIISYTLTKREEFYNDKEIQRMQRLIAEHQ